MQIIHSITHSQNIRCYKGKLQKNTTYCFQKFIFAGPQINYLQQVLNITQNTVFKNFKKIAFALRADAENQQKYGFRGFSDFG